jgi:hypothetical protein
MMITFTLNNKILSLVALSGEQLGRLSATHTLSRPSSQPPSKLTYSEQGWSECKTTNLIK